MKKQIIGLFSFFFLIACATPTPYQPSRTNEGGYREQKLEETKYRISFIGNTLTPRETVEIYLLYRAAELTKERGFDHFTLNEQHTGAQMEAGTSTPAFYGGHGWSGRRRVGFPYYAYGYPWAYQSYNTSDPRYEAVAFVSMTKGARAPADAPNTYDANEVLKNLEPRILRPNQGK